MQATPGEMGRDLERPNDMYERRENYEEIKKIGFHTSIIMNNHASQFGSNNQTSLSQYLSQKKVWFTAHPKRALLVTVGSDKELIFWSIQTHKSKLSNTLNGKATCVKFSPKDGRFLCVGYESGLVEIYSVTFEKDKKGVESDIPSQKILKILETRNTSVINIEFSDEEKYLAISYLNKEISEEGENKICGFVKVYHVASPQPNKPESNKKEKEKEVQFTEYRKIYPQKDDPKKFISPMLAAFFFSFSFDEDSKEERYIIINFQLFDNYLNKETDDKERCYVIWDLVEDVLINNPDDYQKAPTPRFNFPNHINANYRYHEKYLDHSFNKLDSSTSPQNMIITAMKHFDDKFICFGSSRGDINLVKDSCLHVNNNITIESLKENQYCLGKSYAAHNNAVEIIEVVGNKMFTCCAGDESVYEWNISRGKTIWEADHREYDMNREDRFFREIEKRDEYKKIVDDLLEARLEIPELLEQIERKEKPEIVLGLEKVIGRKAFNRRNNLYYTANNHLLFSAASLLVMLNIPPEGKELTTEEKKDFYNEKFLELDYGNIDNTSPEISTFTITPDRRYVCVGTIQKKARLITWDITTNTYMKSWSLEGCCVVLHIKYSNDMNRLICLALTENYTQMIKLIDNRTSEVLGSCDFSYSIPFRIKGIEFLPKSNDEFFTIGFQHLSKWKLKGGLIVFSELPIENSEERMKNAGIRAQKEQMGSKENLEVIFIAIIFLFEELMITAGDDGFVN